MPTFGLFSFFLRPQPNLWGIVLLCWLSNTSTILLSRIKYVKVLTCLVKLYLFCYLTALQIPRIEGSTVQCSNQRYVIEDKSLTSRTDSVALALTIKFLMSTLILAFSFAFLHSFICYCIFLIKIRTSVVQKKCSGIDVSSKRILMCPQGHVLGLEDFALWPWPRTPCFDSQVLGIGFDNQVLDSNTGSTNSLSDYTDITASLPGG